MLFLFRICEGVKDPDVVLREQIEKYKQVFIEAAANVRTGNKSLRTQSLLVDCNDRVISC